MNTTTAPALATAASFIRLEPAPALGSGSLATEADRLWVTLAHLLPIIAWPLKKSASPAVAAHGKEALNFGITLFILSFGIGLLGGVLAAVVGTWFALVTSLLTSVLGLAALGLAIFGALKAREGKLLRYPVNFRFIK